MFRSRNSGDKLLEMLQYSFFRGSHNFDIEHTDVSLMTWDWQKKLLDSTINNKLVRKYPINRQFVRIYLKKIIEHLEGNQEVHDDFYLHLCHTMNNSVADDRFCYKHYMINNELEVITLKETNKMVVNGTTGMKTWEAALMLADWALCHREIFANKSILELGSGVGFTGITIARLCHPKSIYLTDCHPDVLKSISDNIRINFPQSETIEVYNTTMFQFEEKTVGCMLLDWNNVEEISEDIVPDVVIGADIVYDPTLLQPLCDVLQALFVKNKHLEVFIASVIRNEETFEYFLKCLDGKNFSYQKLVLNESVYIDWDQSIQKCMLKIWNK